MKTKISIPIDKDPAIQNLLARIPQEVKSSFSDEQLFHLRNAVATRQWGNHSIDYRTTFRFLNHRYYMVFLMGRNVREISREQMKRQLFFNAVLVSLFICFCTIVGVIILYLAKSALGIDLLENFSLGLWEWTNS